MLPPGSEPQGEPRVEAIAATARRLAELRDSWLNPPGAAEAEPKRNSARAPAEADSGDPDS